MKELLRSNDPVLISFVSALLEEAGIELHRRRHEYERAGRLDWGSAAAGAGGDDQLSRAPAAS